MQFNFIIRFFNFKDKNKKANSVFFNVFLRDLRDAKQKTKSLEKRITTGFSRLFVWCARLDSNQRPSGSEPNALSN